MQTFIIDDGTREINLTNQFNEPIATIRVRTSDISIYDRYQDLMSDFPNIVSPLANINIDADGSTENGDDWKILKDVEANLIARLNALFDTKDIGRIFKKRNAFSAIGGHFFVENVMNTLGQIITEAIEEEARLTQARTGEYLKDITPGVDSNETGDTANKS